MDRLRRISQLWNWLPSFRAVAETEHLRLAADRLNTSPSALSRTVKLLEEDLGHQLFDRKGRQLRVNPVGRALLNAVRESMRRIHDVTQDMESSTTSGPLRISTESMLVVPFVVPSLLDIRTKYPAIRPRISTQPPRDPLTALRIGDIDVLLQTSATSAADLRCERVGMSTRSVYCGRRHPLFGTTDRIDPDDVAKYPFVASSSEFGHLSDGWPVKYARTVCAVVAPEHTSLEVCRETDLLAVLPDRVTEHEVNTGQLFRIQVPELPEVPFYSTIRQSIGYGLVEAFLETLRKVVGSSPPVELAGG